MMTVDPSAQTPRLVPTTGARLTLDVLADEGVDVIFGYPGGAIMPLYDALYDHRVRHVLTRREDGAAFAAGGYARATGRVGVCVATSGPGATNLVTGILDALMDSVPLVALTGQVRTPLIGTDAFQEADTVGIAHVVTKRSVLVRSVDELEPALRTAFRMARGPRPGPVLVDLPQDVLKAVRATPFTATTGARATTDARAVTDLDAVRRTAELIRRARRPVAIVGGGARSSAGAVERYRELCRLLELPHTATINGLGCGECGDERFLGMLGMHGWKAANLAVTRADLVLALGMRFDDRVTGRPDRFAPAATIVHADVDASEFGKIVAADVAIRGDLAATLAALLAALRDDPEQPPVPSFAAWAAEAAALGGRPPRDRTPDGELSATDVLDALFALAPDETIVSTDVGQHQMWAAQRARPAHPRHFLTSAGLGAMGFGLPAAIGAQLAHPGAPVVAIVGDGGVQMTIAELATLRRYDLPVKILLIDNRRLGMVRQWQELFYERRYSATDLSDNPDFVALAAAFGVAAESISTQAQVPSAIDRLLRSHGSRLLHCACHPTENVWPLIPPGAAIDAALEAVPLA